MSNDSLKRDLDDRARMTATLLDWDNYILGENDQLLGHRQLIGEIARSESARWQHGRFPSVTLCVADAVFSKQKKYEVAVRRAIRPFAQEFANTNPAEFASLGWERAFARVIGHGPKLDDRRTPHHLSTEGRYLSIQRVLEAFEQAGRDDVDAAREWARTPEIAPSLTKSILAAPGVAEAMLQNIQMNLGAMKLKLDTHVRRVLASHFDLHDNASAAHFEERLASLGAGFGWSPFEIDQLIWYSESASGSPAQLEQALPRGESGDQRVAKPLVKEVLLTKTPEGEDASEIPSRHGVLIEGKIRDIDPNGAAPRLELYFPGAAAVALAKGKKEIIQLNLGGSVARGTMRNTPEIGHAPYVHTKLECAGEQRRCTELFESLGHGAGTTLSFEVEGPHSLKLVASMA